MTESKWCIKESELLNLDPIKARDLIISCFYEAQKETFARAKQLLHSPIQEEDILTSVITIVKEAFLQTAGDFQNPTKESLAKAVEVLAKKAALWHTPPDIIDYHKQQINKVLYLLHFMAKRGILDDTGR